MSSTPDRAVPPVIAPEPAFAVRTAFVNAVIHRGLRGHHDRLRMITAAHGPDSMHRDGIGSSTMAGLM